MDGLRFSGSVVFASCAAGMLLASALLGACGDDVETLPDDTGTTGSATTVTATSGSSTSAIGSQTSNTAVTSAATSASSSSSTGGCQGLGDACSDCAANVCNAEYCSCYGNATCGALLSCIGNCPMGDEACGQACLTGNKDGIATALVLSHCAATSCSAECPTARKAGDCELCALKTCPQQMNTCLANPACPALIACAQACGPNNPICLGSCALQHGGGQADATAVRNCLGSTCDAACM